MNHEKLVVCVGAQKSGTTSLYGAMKCHPNVCVTPKKETGFFYDDGIFSNGYRWFLDENFLENCTDKIFFEADPNYMYFSRCVERIYQCNPETKIIVMLRNPVDRAFSQYLMMTKWALEDLTFQEACDAEQRRISINEWQKADFGYVDRSRYAGQIENLLNIFPRKQIYFVLFEEFVSRQAAVLSEIQAWLELPVINIKAQAENMASLPRSQFVTKILHQPKYEKLRKTVGKILGGNKKINYLIGYTLEKLNQVSYRKDNKGKYPKLDEEMRNRLFSELYEDIAQVKKLTGIDVVSAWR